MKAPRSYSLQHLKALWGLSGGICAFPGCTTRVIEFSESQDPIVIGEIAHILASSNSGPRSASSDTGIQRDEYDNLIVLCPTHHTLIDKNPSAYPEITLRAWKLAQETNVQSTIERWKDGRLFLALTREQTLESIAYYNETIHFDYSNPNDYHRLQMLLSKQRLFEYWCDLAKTGVKDNRDLYELGAKLAGFMRIVGFVEEAATIYKHLEAMIPHVFDPSSMEFKNERRMLLHNLQGRYDNHQQEIEFCIQEFGDQHVHTIASLTCRGCVLIRSGQLALAEEVLDSCVASLSQLPAESPVRSAYLSFQLGKLNYFMALNRGKSRFHIEKSIFHLRAALDFFTLVREDHVTKNYVHFFLFKVLMLSGAAEEAIPHYKEARQFFSSTPLKNMCHHDFRQMQIDLKLVA